MFNPESVPYMLTLVALAGVAAALAIFGFRRRFASGAVAFAVLMLAVVQWSSGYALEIGARTLEAKIFWARWEYFGIVTLPVAWAIFAMQVRSRVRGSMVQLTLLLKIVPLITVLLVWTNDAHHLIWRSATLDQSGPFPALNTTYGPFFWVHTAYTQLLLIYGTALLASVLRWPNLYRRQVAAILFGIVAPWIANALFIAKLSPIPNLDLTPFAFTATGAAFGWSLFRLRFLDVVPIAYDAIIGSLRDGVLVLDQRERIVDVNPVGAAIVGRSSADLIGRSAAQVLPAGLRDALAREGAEARVALEVEQRPQTYDVTVTRLADRRGRPAGTVLVLRDVTARQQTEDALRASEERYRVVSELTTDYAYSLFLPGNGAIAVDWITDAFSRITGLTIEDVQARGGWLSLIHPGDKDAAIDNALQLTAGRSTVSEFRIVTKTGDTRWIRTYSRPIWDSGAGRVTRLLGAGQDITARRQAEVALSESEARYRSLFDNGPNPMWVYDVETRAFLAVNEAAIAHYGYERAEFLQMRLDDIRPEDESTAGLAALASSQDTRLRTIVRHRKRDGTPTMVEVAVQPVSLSDRPARIVVAIDVTARLAAEAALRQQNEYLGALHETALALINRLEVEDVLLTIVVRAGQLVGTSHGYMYLVEPETDDLVVHIGVGHFEGRRGYRIRRDESQGVAGIVRATGQPFAVADYQSWSGQRPDLAGEPFRATVGTPLTSGGEVIGVLGLAYVEVGRTFEPEAIEILSRFAQLASIALDNARLYTTAQQEIAERTRAEAALALARDEALEAARLKAGFLAAMSHELRTPLNAIIGFTELTLEERSGALNPVHRSNLQRVSRNAHSLLTLIDSILDMSKIDAGRMQLQVERVFLEQIVLGAVASVETLVEAKQLTLNVRRSQRFTPVVFGDSFRLHQIVVNLLSNAVKFTPAGGAITVLLEWDAAAAIKEAAAPSAGRPSGEWVALSIVDSGIGIPPEEHERVWSEFYQVDHGTTRQFGGTGLGLAIVRRLTLLMNGQVGVASEPDHGSTFSVWLPAHPHDALPPNNIEHAGKPQVGEETLRW